MAKVLVKSSKTGVATIGLGYIRHATDDKAILGSRLLTLKPGLNEVDEDEWLIAKKLPVVQYELEMEILSEVSGASLADFSVPKAQKLVRECNDKDLLEKWKSQETRPSVLAAIGEQFKKFEPVPKGAGRR